MSEQNNIPAFSHRIRKKQAILRQLSDELAWVVKEDFNGKKTYYNKKNETFWAESVDENNDKIYVQIDQSRSVTSLPVFDNSDLTNITDDFSKRSTFKNDEDYSSFSSSSDDEETDLEKKEDLTRSSIKSEKFTFRRKSKTESFIATNKSINPIYTNGKLNWNNISKDQISGPIDNKFISERRAVIHRAKYSENGKVISKKWQRAFLVLIGPQLFVYRDQKASIPKTNLPNGKPEITMNVSEINVAAATRSVTSRQNTLVIESLGAPGSSVVYLFEFEKDADCNSWKYALNYSKELDMEKKFTENNRTSALCPINNEQGSIVKFLKEFLKVRVSREQLIARGIIKNEPVFGSSIHEICEYENSDVPSFVTRLIMAVELRGLKSPGIYRMSGNSAKIQALRMEVDQYEYNLNSEKWDFDVLTGSLKLFFRELKDPLFSNDVYNAISNLMKEYEKNYEEMKRILKTMPSSYLNTATVLFHHLYRIVKDPDNKMTSGNIAIVFGPNLLHDDGISSKESPYQAIGRKNFFVEYLITNTPKIFGDPVPPPISNFLPPS